LAEYNTSLSRISFTKSEVWLMDSHNLQGTVLGQTIAHIFLIDIIASIIAEDTRIIANVEDEENDKICFVTK
jgi:hypothetical protein